MEQNMSFWGLAAKVGLILGVFSAIPDALGIILSGSAAGTLIAFILWLVKFVGCIWIMRFFMRSYASGIEEPVSSDAFKFGLAAAALSALIYSGLYLAFSLYVVPDYFANMFDEMLPAFQEMMPTLYTDEVVEQMKGFIPRLPVVMFWSNLFRCFIYGLVLSAILCGSSVPNDPFRGSSKYSDDSDDTSFRQ